MKSRSNRNTKDMISKIKMFLFFFIINLNLCVIVCTSHCEDFVTCGTCVFDPLEHCVWCPMDDHKGKRCQPKHLTNETWCKNVISKPESEQHKIKDDNWSSGEDNTNIVQLRPQKAAIAASPGVSVNITMYYKPAKDAPLDIYFLIDNSKNIEDSKKSLIDQIQLIFNGLTNYTNNIYLGIGTFIEKPVLPFANPDKYVVYPFRNDWPLTDNVDKLISTLKNIKSGKNYDSPEDLFDGLMQIMLCKQKIGWRNDSRRIIVTFTNEFYHSAGDGKMIGAFKRFNMQCYENDEMYTVTDYPSISQVNKITKEKGYIIIFAHVPNNLVQTYYEMLSKKVYGSKSAMMTYENIAEIVKKEYITMIEEVSFDIQRESDTNIEVTLNRKCPKCIAMNNNPLEYDVIIKVVSCNSRKEKEVIKIIPRSMNEELQIEVKFQCHCECERKNLKEINLKKCSGEGNYECGICKCNPNRYGDTCGCKSESVNQIFNYQKCRKNPNDAFQCSGHGECSCEKCECHEGFSGPFCEYDVNACPRPGGKLCSGHGKCEMAVCACYPNWIHSPNGINDCGCTIETTTCVAPHSKKICSGNGKCNCGRCDCTKMENFNDTCSGRYCDKCSWFTAKRCEELEAYAYCRFLNQTTCQNGNITADTTVIFANRTEINSPNNTKWYMANLCRVKKGDNENIFVFKYYYTSDSNAGAAINDTMLTLVIQSELDEKPPADIWVPIASAIGGIILIGLLTLLLWKLITDFYDKREYDQFVEKAKAQGYNVEMTNNPWYTPPTTTFVNPTHNANLQ